MPESVSDRVSDPGEGAGEGGGPSVKWHAETDRIIALYRRLEEAQQIDLHALSDGELLQLWVDAEEVRSWALARRLEALAQLERRRRRERGREAC